jgi:hypothetical protein
LLLVTVVSGRVTKVRDSLNLVVPLPNTMINTAYSIFSKLSAIFAEIDPIERTLNSYKNHEFIPPHGKTNNNIQDNRMYVLIEKMKNTNSNVKNQGRK